jgi:hypothetical protein
MKTGIIKKSDIIHIKRQKLSNVIMSAIGKKLLIVNFLTFKKLENQLIGLFNWIAKKRLNFILKK